jgi:DNA-binding XRE family transcriptional regulator/phage-related protein
VPWKVEILDRRVVKELESLSDDVRQRFLRISELIEKHGRSAMHEPHIKHLEGKLWEMRMTGRDGIARALFVTAVRDRVVVVHAFAKEDAEDPVARARGGPPACEGGDVMGIPLKTVARKWLKDPEFKAGYDALEEEFALASLLIEARTRANLTQAELASKMGTSQSTIARLESGKAAPSLSTLRRLAKATGTRLEISFEPKRPTRRTRSTSAA